MKLVNTFEVVPQTADDKACLLRLFDAAAALWNELTYERRQKVRPMARPVRFEWDDHDWSGNPHPHDRPKEARTNPQVASVESA